MKNKTFHEIVKKHTFENTDIFFKMNALIGEIGELANVLKKNEFYKFFKDVEIKNIERLKTTSDGLRNHIEEELGDVIFYIYQIMNDLHYSADLIMKIQENKLNRQSNELNRIFLK